MIFSTLLIMKKIFLLLLCFFYSANSFKRCLTSQTVITVTSKNIESGCHAIGGAEYCSNITAALSRKSLNNTCVLLKENQNLSQPIDLLNLNEFSLIGEYTTIHCNSNNKGIRIINSQHLALSYITVSDCGLYNTGDFNNTDINISSAIYLNNVNNINLTGIVITGSFGYGLVSNYCNGNINFENLVIEKNVVLSPFGWSPGYSSGGGVLMWFTNSTGQNIIIFSNCTFQNNTGEQDKSVEISLDEGLLPYGRGAGLSVLFGGFSSANNLIIRDCKFLNNKGLWGGGFFLIFQGNSRQNIVYIKNTLFQYNVAELHGGGTRISSSRTSKYHTNKIHFYSCNFSYNTAEFGGAISHHRQYFTEQEVTRFTNCSVSRNTGQLGAAIYMARVTVVFVGLQCNFHNLVWQTVVAQGTIYTYTSALIFYGSNEIKHNKNTAVVLDFSSVIINAGRLHLIGNSGSKGAGFALFQHSKIILNATNAELVFINNTAYRNGGAIFMESTLPGGFYSPTSNTYPCFLSKRNPQSKIYYSNNNAMDEKNDVFATSLKTCYQVINDFATRYIETDPVTISLNLEDWNNLYPGKWFRPEITLIDELGHNVSRSIDVYTNNIPQTHSFLVLNNSILIGLSGNIFELFNVTVLYGNIGIVLTNLQFDPCPFAYTLFKGVCICESKKNLLKGLICEENGSVSLFHGLYTDYYNESSAINRTVTTYLCPYGYCSTCKEFSCSISPLKQCAGDRYGFLCSKCPANMTVELGGEKCIKQCSWYNLFYILAIILGIFFLICFVMIFLNVCIFDTWLNSTIYVYQVIQYHITASQLMEESFITTSIINLLNFRGIHFGKSNTHFCLVRNWNDLDKMFFNYTFPFVMLLSVAIISQWRFLFWSLLHLNMKFKNLICKSDRNAQTHFLRIYVLISVLAYADITRITYSILHPTEHNGVKSVYIYGEQKFFYGRHLYYAAVAIFVGIFIVLLWPILLITTSFWTKWKYFRKFGAWYPVFTEFHGKFHGRYQWFASCYFLSRLVIIALGIFIDNKVIQLTSVTMVSLLLLIVFLSCWPYRNDSSNYFDSFLLFLLVLCGILTIEKYGMDIGKYDTFLFDLTKFVMYLPCVVVFRWFYCFLNWINFKGYAMRCWNGGCDNIDDNSAVVFH